MGEQKENIKLPPTRTYHFEEGGKADEKHSIRKWIRDNIMLLITLTGVLIGIVTGTHLFFYCIRELRDSTEPPKFILLQFNN